MITEKLYESNSYIGSFEAVVLSCEQNERGYKSILDKTAFFPQGGGQPCDKGFISGIDVFDVQIENGEIFHFTKTPLETGKTVKGEIDFARRFNFMQNHTAEHIVSGLVFKKYGYSNIGFHLNENEVTFDFDGFFSESQLKELEFEANRRVWQNLKVTSFYPDNSELKNISYRSKSGIDGEIRLVSIENTDICACCAPHVKSTGEIGLIKFLGTEKQHGGTRIFMRCGEFALSDYDKKHKEIKRIGEALSTKEDEVFNAVLSLCERLENEKQTLKDYREKLIDYQIKTFDSSKMAILSEYSDIKDLQVLADGLHKTYGGVRIAFGINKEGCSFVMCGDSEILEEEFKKLKTVFSIKGGGRGEIRQGCILSAPAEIKEYFDLQE